MYPKLYAFLWSSFGDVHFQFLCEYNLGDILSLLISKLSHVLSPLRGGQYLCHAPQWYVHHSHWRRYQSHKPHAKSSKDIWCMWEHAFVTCEQGRWNTWYFLHSRHFLRRSTLNWPTNCSFIGFVLDLYFRPPWNYSYVGRSSLYCEYWTLDTSTLTYISSGWSIHVRLWCPIFPC